MKYRLLLSILALTLCFNVSAQQRTKERVKNRAERRANQRVDQKVDNVVDDAFDALGGLFKKKKKKKKKVEPQPEPTTTQETGATDGDVDADDSEAGMEMLGKLLGGGKEWVPYTNPQSFSLTIEVTEPDGKVNPIQMAVTSTKLGMKMLTNGEEIRTILDTQTGKSTTITKDKYGNYSGVRMNLPDFSSFMEKEVEETMDDLEIEATDEYRTIDGYKCQKYVFRNKEDRSYTESWITKDLKIKPEDLYNSMKSQPNRSGSMAPWMAKIPEGFPILIKTVEKNNKTYTTHYKDIKFGASQMDTSILDISGIPVEDIGF